MSKAIEGMFNGQQAPVAAELFAASWCNLDCKYCYIPKHNQGLIDEHKKIIEDIKKVDPVINRLKKIYGTNLQTIGHWGSEPSLTIKHFYNFYDKAIDEFPKLNTISMSSNFQSNTSDVVEFIKNFTDKKPFNISIQGSLDGPQWITDENRKGGATEDIINNMVYFVRELNEHESIHKTQFKFKPTVSKEQYALLKKKDNILEYYKFFDDVFDRLINANTRNNVSIFINCHPTLVCPDDYTQQDGINFNELYLNALEIEKEHDFKYVKPDSGYYGNLTKLLILGNEFFTKQKMFTCSAGDSQFGISDYLHPCHDTFYLPSGIEEEFMSQDPDRINSSNETNNVNTGRTKFAKNNLTLKLSNLTDKDVNHYKYKMRAFHDFTKQKISGSIAIIKEMAYCGQISECYKNTKMAEILAIYTLSRHSCPTRQYSYMGSLMIVDINFFRVFGNGLLENFLKRTLNETTQKRMPINE